MIMVNMMGSTARTCLACLLGFLLPCAGWAEEFRPNTELYRFRFPNEVNGRAVATTVIGRVGKHTVRDGETLLDIARDYHLGFEELVQANPSVDPWVPALGAVLTIPAAWILPKSAPRGLVLNIPEMRLYYYVSENEVMTFPLGIGMEGWDTPAGNYWIGEKRIDPVWYVPESIQREMEVPRKVVPPGPDNPLGRYWMRLSDSSYGIHGTNNPWAVGRNVTHGCIRLYPEDIAFLFPRVKPKTPVQVTYQYAKVGERNGDVYFQIYRYNGRKGDGELFTEVLRQLLALKIKVKVEKLRDLVRDAKDGELVAVPVPSLS